MKLRFYYLFCSFFLIFYVTELYSQTTTFDRTYPQLGDSTIGYSTNILLNGNYLISGYSHDSLLIAKFDENGKLLRYKKYQTNQRFRHKPTLLLPDGNIMAVSTKKTTDGNRKIYILKLNSSGDTVWTKTYGGFLSFSEDEGIRIFQTSDNNFIVFGLIEWSGSSKRKISIIIINNSGEIQSANFVSITSGRSIPRYSIEKINDNRYVIAEKYRLLIVDATGNIVSDKNYKPKYIYNLGLTYDHKILIILSNNLIKLDEDGNIISTIELEKTGNYMYIIKGLPNGNILISNNERILEMDEAGNLLWTNALGGTPNSQSQTADGGFILTGDKLGNDNYSIYLWLLKSDSTGFYKALQLRNPLRGSNLELHSCVKIEWFSAGIDYVDISYSSDNGFSWENIGSQIKSNNGKNDLDWHAPDFVSDRAFIKISASDDQAFIDSVSFSVYYDPDPYPGYKYIAGNQIKMFVSNNGDGSYDPVKGGSGFFWPGGFCAKTPAIFEDGLVYGGIVDGNINVNGSAYRHGWQPGVILPNGMPADSEHISSSIWKINKNWNSMPAGPIKDEYAFNYENWPGQYGAPFADTDGDGKFTKGIDKPQFIGDEVLYFTSNDLDSTITSFVYGSPPIGLEFHITLWAYDTDDFLQDVVFKKYQIINKGNKTINDMYLSYWVDDDLGDANDDYDGSDSTLSLGFTYNADNDDVNYYGLNPPAVGHLLVQGPVVKAEPTDSAKFKGNWKKGYKNLPMTSFVFYIGGSSTYALPETGTLRGAENFYNNMQGLLWNGENYINPNTGEPTKFALAGDPVSGTGWYEGAGWSGGEKPGDRRYSFSSGPFTMAPGDTQEVVYAIFMAQGSDNIQSVAELKNTAVKIHDFYDKLIITGVNDNNERIIPGEFKLYQNYPNPFNPTTVIKYSIPNNTVIAIPALSAGRSNPSSFNSDKQITSLTARQASGTPFPRNDGDVNVKLEVYDILGRVVATPVNEKQSPGNYEVKFNAENLSSGVYIYRLKIINGFNTMTQTRKMILLK